MRRTCIVVAALLLGSSCESEKAQRQREEAEAARRAEEQRLREKRLEEYYDLEWIKCVNELGIDRCKTIQEIGLFKYSTSSRGLDESARHIMDDRHEWLVEQDENPEPKDEEATPEAEELPAEAEAPVSLAEDPAP